MKRDEVDILLQLAFLEGRIGTRGAYEKSVLRKKTTSMITKSKRIALQERLEGALASEVASEEIPLTVGAFLKSVRSEHSLRAEDIFKRLGISQNIYRMLEHDRISPLKVPSDSWNRIRRFFDLSADVLVEMIRRTHQLVYFRPSFKTTLARYDARKKKGLKASTIEQATSELYIKAKLDLPPKEKAKLDELLKSIKEQM